MIMVTGRKAALAILMTGVPAPALAGPHGWDRATDVGRDVLVVAALGVPAIQGDWKV